MSKRNFFDKDIREALGRILRDRPMPNDGLLLLEGLEAVREAVDPRLPEGCALQAEYGRRKFASDLIEIGREEYERVTESQAGMESRGRFGSAIGYVAGTGVGAGDGSGRKSRRRGPAAAWVDSQT